LTLWLWVRRGVAEVYCKVSGIKGGTGLNITAILEREEKYLKENPKKTIVNPAIHPEYIGRMAFNKLSPNLEKLYKELVQEKRATGDLTDEEKKKYGIEIKANPKQIIKEVINRIKKGEINDKKTLWEELNNIKQDDEKKLKLLNFYLKLEGWGSFDKLFKKDNARDIKW
jgi:regulator of sigma D